MIYPAHIRIMPNGSERIQTTEEHNRNTAEIAAKCLEIIGLGDAAWFAGLTHDAGKDREASRIYQMDAAHGKQVKRGSVIHTFQGCRLILEKHTACQTGDKRDITRELTAYAVAAHHGLFDLFGENRYAGFLTRIEKTEIEYETCKTVFLQGVGGEDAFERYFERAHAALLPVYDLIDDLAGNSDEEYYFYFTLLARLLLSAVIEGDRRDTAVFMNDAVFRDDPADMRPVWRRLLAHMEMKLDGFQSVTPIDKARRSISELCRAAAEQDGGIFRLNVPTGGGKTLSALRFALAHAAKHNKRRVIFTTPLLSILEQNSKVLREFIGDESVILEHHSNLIRAEEDGDVLAERELLTQCWDSPVIITTLVQLLNTMFSGKTSAIRRFWALCGSVIVIDEVQTVPGRFLSLFNLAVNFLSNVCGVTFVLCSATQPCFEAAEHPMQSDIKDIVPFNADLWKPFRRTDLIHAQDRPLAEIPAFAEEVLLGADSLLIVCNKKNEASYLFRELKSSDCVCFHLSASMCMAHRRCVIEDMFTALERSRKGGPKVLCVSTQVIEAGVDISFSRVIRLTAGMDSVIQSAGRCNRNGESSVPVPVYILTCSDEDLKRLNEIQMGRSAASEMLTAYRKQPQRFDENLTSDAAIGYYYKRLFGKMKDEYQDGPLPDKKTMLSLLSDNPNYANEDSEGYGQFFLLQAFRTAGSAFRVFDEDTQTAVVPYEEGEALIAEAAAWEYPPDDNTLAEWLERVKPYTVTLYEYQKKELAKNGMYMIAGVPILQPFQYDNDTGVIPCGGNTDFLEV